MSTNVKYTGRLSPAEVEILQKEHKNVAIIEVPVNDDWTEIAIGYLKPVDRPLMSAVLSTTDKVKQAELLLDALWLGGDERIRKDDDLFFSAMPELYKMITFHQASLKKN